VSIIDDLKKIILFIINFPFFPISFDISHVMPKKCLVDRVPLIKKDRLPTSFCYRFFGPIWIIIFFLQLAHILILS